MRVYIADELKCVYRLENDVLVFASIADDGTFDLDEFDPVEPDLIGSEPVTFLGKETTFNEVYKVVINILKTPKENN